MKQPKKIGIFGGSFDPIHNAHTNLASLFIKKLKLDKLMIIPTANSPHKTIDSLTDAEHRLNMCKLACENIKKCEVSDIEIKRSGISYTVNTLNDIKQLYPDSELYLIMGADMFMSLDTWKKPDEIMSLASICTVPRNNDDINILAQKEQEYIAGGCRTIILETKKSDISSTMIRQFIYDDRGFSKYVDSKVEKYIYSNYLYMNKDTINYDRFDKVLKARMGDKRYIHSLNVAAEAQRLAKKYGADEEKAKLAGTLHDITKETPSGEQLAIINKCGIELNSVESYSPKLWHAIAGAGFVSDVMGITDKDVFNAIRYHTSGRANMSLLEKCVFIADFIGAERDYDGVNEMRALADKSLEEAMVFGLSFSISDLAKRKQAIDPNSIACYNEVVLLSGKNIKNKGA